MPSRAGEGISRVIYIAAMACGHVVEYLIGPSEGDEVYCLRCSGGTTVQKITRKPIAIRSEGEYRHT